MFERLSDEGLAQSSFLIACERTRTAAVIDPRRDIDAYTSTATRHGLTLAYAIETHIHADFVSGARELAALGARVVAGPGAALRFPFHEATHGESLRVGDIAIEVLHTPGHTPEHISLLVREPDRPARLFTGDTLFVGAVGRPDLLGADQARGLASQLYDSLFDDCWPSTMPSKSTPGMAPDRSAARASARRHIRPSARNAASTRSCSRPRRRHS